MADIVHLYSPAVMLPDPASVSAVTSFCAPVDYHLPEENDGFTPAPSFTDDLGRTVDRWDGGVAVYSPAARQLTPEWLISQDASAQGAAQDASAGAVTALLPEQTYLPGRFGVQLVGSVWDGYDDQARKAILAWAMGSLVHRAADLLLWTGQAFPLAAGTAVVEDTPCLGSTRGRTYAATGRPQSDANAWPLGYDLSDTAGAGYHPDNALAIAEELCGLEYSDVARTSARKIGSLGQAGVIHAARDVVGAWQRGGQLFNQTVAGGGPRQSWSKLWTPQGTQVCTGPGATGASVAGLTGTAAEARSLTKSYVYVTVSPRVVVGRTTYFTSDGQAVNKQTNTKTTRAEASVTVMFDDLSKHHRILVNPLAIK